MANSTSKDSTKKAIEASDKEGKATPLRCFTGALISGGLATLLYFLTQSIMQAFASKPPSGNFTAINISVAVRTLVVGMSVLATAVFSIAALGLVALGIQMLAQSSRSQDSNHKPES